MSVNPTFFIKPKKVFSVKAPPMHLNQSSMLFFISSSNVFFGTRAQIGTASVLVANGLAIASAIILRDICFVVVVLGIVAFDIYLYYFRLQRKKEPRYPLVPPEGKGDVYLPRTDIPRLIHEDVRRMREKKRRFEKIEKLRRRKKSATRLDMH